MCNSWKYWFTYNINLYGSGIRRSYGSSGTSIFSGISPLISWGFIQTLIMYSCTVLLYIQKHVLFTFNGIKKLPYLYIKGLKHQVVATIYGLQNMSFWRIFNSFCTALNNEICNYMTNKEQNKWVLDNLNFSMVGFSDKHQLLYIRLVCVKSVIF